MRHSRCPRLDTTSKVCSKRKRQSKLDARPERVENGPPGGAKPTASIETWLDRRQVLAGAAGSMLLLATWPQFSRAAAGAASNPATLPPVPDVPYRLAFFNEAEAAFIDGAIARLIPADALGAGAVEAGVTQFIDRQLAGPFGQATDWYMTGPWADGTTEQGYQRRRTPAEVYRAAIRAIDEHVRKTSGKAFAALPGTVQDDLLHALEDGKLDLGDVSADTFFTLLWQNTQEGYFADPLYLGNRGFTGWKLIGYPGPRYNYDGAIRHFGQPYPEPTVGLLGRDPLKPKESRL